MKTLNNKGFTLIEAMVGMAIIAFVMVGILSTFAQQQMLSRKDAEKNTAIILAETKLEELLKFSSQQLQGEDFSTKGDVVEFITHKEGIFKNYDVDPNEPKQYRRTTRVTLDLLGQLATLRVTVEYGRAKKDINTFVYPFQIVLTTRRGL